MFTVRETIIVYEDQLLELLVSLGDKQCSLFVKSSLWNGNGCPKSIMVLGVKVIWHWKTV